MNNNIVRLDSTYYQPAINNNEQPRWNVRKTCHLRKSLTQPTTLDFTKTPKITPQLVLDLISKINPNNDKTLYFVLPEALQNYAPLKNLKAPPQLEEEFSKLSITAPPVVQKMLSTPQIQPSKLFGLPFRLQGQILSFLPAKEIMQLERTVTSWTYDVSLQIALRGKEDEVATTSLRSMLQKGVATIPSALEPIRDRVKKLDFSY